MRSEVYEVRNGVNFVTPQGCFGFVTHNNLMRTTIEKGITFLSNVIKFWYNSKKFVSFPRCRRARKGAK